MFKDLRTLNFLYYQLNRVVPLNVHEGLVSWHPTNTLNQIISTTKNLGQSKKYGTVYYAVFLLGIITYTQRLHQVQDRCSFVSEHFWSMVVEFMDGNPMSEKTDYMIKCF